jgi:hypothetical protein
MPRTYLVVDPGLKNCACSLVTIRTEGPDQVVHAEIPWTLTLDLSGKVNPDKDKAHAGFNCVYERASEVIQRLHVQLDTVLVEFQPPINVRTNPALARWNSWVEAYAVAFFQGKTFPNSPPAPVKYVHSAALKRFFDIQGGSHTVNKTLALHTARSFLAPGYQLQTDHVADCVLMAIYEFKRG